MQKGFDDSLSEPVVVYTPQRSRFEVGPSR